MNALMRAKLKDVKVKNPSGISHGPLIVPEDWAIGGDGQLIAFAEDNVYLHCVISTTGAVMSVYKSNDPNHMYQHLLSLNTK